jgi:hypothetical protein
MQLSLPSASFNRLMEGMDLLNNLVFANSFQFDIATWNKIKLRCNEHDFTILF